MVVTPFIQVLGPLIATGVSEVSVTDNIDDESDSLSMVCEFSSATIDQEMTVTALAGYQEGALWPLGSYVLQSIEPENDREHLIFTSAAFSDEMKKKRDKSYQKLTLKELVGKVAKRYGLEVKCDMEQKLEHVDQRNESDVALLKRFAEKYNAIFNVKNGTLIFLSKKSDELPHFFIYAGQAEQWHFRQSRKFYYNSVRAKYHDPKQNKKIEIVVGKGAPEYRMEIQAKNKQEAKDLATAKLEKLQAKSRTGSVTIEGQNIIAGGKVTCVGFGKADGEYLITKAVHRVGEKFTSTVELEWAV
jgi:phage protein D